MSLNATPPIGSRLCPHASRPWRTPASSRAPWPVSLPPALTPWPGTLSAQSGDPPIPPRFSPSKTQVLEMTSKSRSRPCAPAAPLGPDAASPLSGPPRRPRWRLRRDPRVPSWAGAEPSVTQRLPSGYHQQHRGPPLTSPENKTSLPDQVEVSRHVARPAQRTPHAPRCR